MEYLRKYLPVIAVTIAIVGVVFFFLRILPIGLTPRHDNDFKHIYLGVVLISKGISPYSLEAMSQGLKICGLPPATPLNPYVYLPFTALSMYPLSFCNLRLASDIWFWCNIVCMLAGGVFLSLSCFTSRNARLTVFGIFCGLLAISHPLFRTLTAGQLNCVLFFCVSAAFYGLCISKPFISGVLLGFAAVFKIAPGFFLIHFVLTKSWKALFAMTATCVVLLLFSWTICGMQMHFDFFPTLVDMGYGRSTWSEYGNTFWKDPTNQSFNSFFTHALSNNNGITVSWLSLTQTAANLITYIVSLTLLLSYAVLTWSIRDTIDRNAAFQTAVLCSLLIPSLFWDHYVLLTLLPNFWVIAFCIQNKRYIMLGMAVACLILLHVPWNFHADLFQHGPGILLMSMKLWPTVILFALLQFIMVGNQKKCGT